MNLVSKSILDDSIYINIDGEWKPLSLSNYKKAWNQGFLYDLLDEMEEKGIPIPMVWNKWSLEPIMEWVLDSISAEQETSYYGSGSVWVYGKPGTLPSEEDYQRVFSELEEQTLLAQAKAEEKKIKAMEEANSLNLLLASFKGGKVLEFNENYLIIETEAGLLKVGAQMVYCSTGDYEGYDEARLHFSKYKP